MDPRVRGFEEMDARSCPIASFGISGADVFSLMQEIYVNTCVFIG
jgi:hypothetical protein